MTETTSTARTGHCAICDKPLRPGLLMCASHWRLVPRDLQGAVYKTWGSLQRCPTRAHFHNAVRGEYFKARDAAIAAVNERLEGAEPATQGDQLVDDE